MRRTGRPGARVWCAPGMDVALGVLLGMVLAASLWAGWRLVAAPRRVIDPGSVAMQSAVHAAISLLPHLRQGLGRDTAGPAAAQLRLLTGADSDRGGRRRHAARLRRRGRRPPPAGRPAARRSPSPAAATACRSSAGSPCPEAGCPLRSAIIAPLRIGDARVGSVVALYEQPGRVRVEESRVVGEAAALVSAMIELSELDAQGERLAVAELRALRAQISPHFIYNALTAVASFIHSRPEEARELLTEFSDFIRYAFARQRPYVTLADELQYVEKYLRLEQARFGDRLQVLRARRPRGAAGGRPAAVAAAAGRERGAPRRRVAPRRRPRRDPRPRPRRRRRAAGLRRRRRASTRSARARRSPAAARGSASATCRRACSRPSAAATGWRSRARTATARRWS